MCEYTTSRMHRKKSGNSNVGATTGVSFGAAENLKITALKMTAEQVKALQVGETVIVRKEGHEPVICMVAFRSRPDNKFLTYRVKGEIKMFAIRDYPDISYERR